MNHQSADDAVLVDDSLFTSGPEPQLIGSRCQACGVETFPRATSCSRCTSQEMADVALPRVGTLWSWTIQGFLPKNPPYAGTETPLTFVPYGVGYVQLAAADGGDGVIVESRLTENNPAKLRIGMDMELTLIPFTTDSDGRSVITFAFTPVEVFS
jgi:uncharacterized protein